MKLLVTQWIDNLATVGNIFQNTANNADFCTWAVQQFQMPSPYTAVSGKIKGVNTVVERLRRCEPSNTLSTLNNGNSMPSLEGTANTMKALVSWVSVISLMSLTKCHLPGIRWKEYQDSRYV